jgi:hypothetical protein
MPKITALQDFARISNIMPQTKSKSRKQTPTKSVVAKHAKGKSTTPRSAALPMANSRTSISVAELPRTHRATANRERKVRDPNIVLNFYTRNL